MFGKKTLRASLLCGAASTIILCSASAANAQQADFNISPQPLSAALSAFSEQSQVAVIFTPDLTATKLSRGVSGSSDVQIALNELLAGTGLSWRKDGNAFVIVRASDPQSGSAAGDGAEGTVAALVVTAQKREEDIQDVPIAISAFTQEDLTRSQVAGGPDLMTQVPNFTFTKTNFSGYSIQIRGIGTQAISATTDPAVAVAFNNTPFIRNRFFEQEFYDLARVEVLRGPQGTLYGRNATAGVVNIISAKPNLRAFEAKVSGDVANYNSTRLEGMINLPIVDDKVALRLAGAWTKRDGYDTNQLTGNRIDGRDLWSARVSLRFEPTDRFRANLIYEHFQEDDDRLRSGKQLCKTDNPNAVGEPFWEASGVFSQGCLPTSLYSPEAFQVPNGYALPYYSGVGVAAPVLWSAFKDAYVSRTQSRDLRVIESTVDPHYQAHSDLAELQMSFDIGRSLTLASETAYDSDVIFSTQDFNRFNTAPGAFYADSELPGWEVPNVLNNGVFCDPQIGCADRVVVMDLSTAQSHQFSQEFRLSSDFEGPFNFSLGTNFLRYDTMEKYYVFLNTLGLWVADRTIRSDTPQPTYVPGVTDNSDCLRRGMVEGGFNRIPGIDANNGCIYMDPNPIGQLNDLGHNYFLSKNPYKLISYAAFGEAYYNITPSLKLTAGLRWTVDKKEAPRIPSWLLANNSVGYPVLEVVRQTWRKPTGRLTLDWKPDLSFTDETLLYMSYSHGYKAGGSNPPPLVLAAYSNNGRSGDGAVQETIVQPKTFDPEYVDAFELGSKNTLADGKMTLNANAFYYDYKGYQISQIINRSAVNYNFDSKVWGLELEADWRPIENLRLGLKAGYEDTRIGKGETAIDIMDRTAGNTDWIVARPFPTVPSNCILPRYTAYSGGFGPVPSWQYNGLPGMCINAYVFHLDPVTVLPYVPNPQADFTGGLNWPFVRYPEEGYYPGFDPLTAPNNGEGFSKDLSGHQLPNAPHYTATLTSDYTLPLPHDWLATLHTDFYYQSEAWSRVFNTPGYDKLKAYYNVNVAAIFANEEAGWQVMAYVKNVLDADNITGAFLNSDDTGLTTNVFLNEPRLYGLRVTKQWTGQAWWTGVSHPAGEPWPLTVEIGGQVQRHDAPTSPLLSELGGDFPLFHPLGAQDQDLDWGDGREVKVTYRPGGAWNLSAGVRFGKTNHRGLVMERNDLGPICPAAAAQFFCDKYPNYLQYPPRYANANIADREDHTIADFTLGRDIGFGALSSGVNLGLRYARLTSATDYSVRGVPDWVLQDSDTPLKYVEHDRYISSVSAAREFEGAGPVVTWDAAHPLFGDAGNHLDLAWTIEAGALFGRQKAHVEGSITHSHFAGYYFAADALSPDSTSTVTVNSDRSKTVTIPTGALSLGLAWEVERFKVGAGYRVERYFDAIDGGYRERKSYDRTIDGPYFKVSVGFGG